MIEMLRLLRRRIPAGVEVTEHLRRYLIHVKVHGLHIVYQQCPDKIIVIG